MAKVQTLKGFRDITPEEALKRGRALTLLKSVFKSYGFVPLETPALEYAELLEGKYGEDEKLIYKFEDRGGRMVALRYDLTVPLARFVAENRGKLVFPFKRYQIQSAFRADKPQAGRYREFTQVDWDTVGVNTALSDAEAIAVAASCLEILGVKNFLIKINDRALFEGLTLEEIRALDKIDKGGNVPSSSTADGRGRAFSPRSKVDPKLLAEIKKRPMTKRLEKVFCYLEDFGISKEKFVFSPTLARGLDYYTGVIFETVVAGYEKLGSLAGGGRYDNLIGIFINEEIPAVGCSFGLDRLMEVIPEKTFADIPFRPQVLVTIFSEDLTEQAIKTLTAIQSRGIDAEIYLDPTAKLDKQLKYADKKGIPYAVIVGPEEIKAQEVTVKDLKSRKQQTLKLEALLKTLGKKV